VDALSDVCVWVGVGVRVRVRVRVCVRGGGERLVEVSSLWIVPAIIYFLSDRGDRLYGGCSVQAPGSGSLPGSAYVLRRTHGCVHLCVSGYRTLKNIDNRANTGRKNVDFKSARYPV